MHAPAGTADYVFCHAYFGGEVAPDAPLKDPAKNVVVADPLIAGSREHRMVRNFVFMLKPQTSVTPD